MLILPPTPAAVSLHLSNLPTCKFNEDFLYILSERNFSAFAKDSKIGNSVAIAATVALLTYFRSVENVGKVAVAALSPLNSDCSAFIVIPSSLYSWRLHQVEKPGISIGCCF